MRPKMVREEIARAKAKHLLRELSIKHPPIIPTAIAQNLGIIVHYHCVEDIDFSFSFKTKGQHAICIYLSGNKGRDNWSAAHELGHIVLGHYELYSVDTVIEERLTNQERYILDREADVFAEELLMPYEWIMKERERKDLEYIQNLFQVSNQALSIRLASLCSS